MIKMMYTEVLEDYDSDLENKTAVTTRKVTFNDIDEFNLNKEIKRLHKDYDLTITIKLKEPPEDVSSDGEESDE